MTAKNNTGKFGPTYPGHYPEEMRTQLWPLCCGARIISGFKHAATISDEELLAEINHTINDMIPDHQVFQYETMMPKLIWLTLNSSQMASKKIMTAIEKVGFVKVLEAAPRGSAQGFFVKDLSGTAKTFAVEKGQPTAQTEKAA